MHDSFCYFVGMIDEELAVVHAVKIFYMHGLAKFEQMLYLRFGYKCLFRAIGLCM